MDLNELRFLLALARNDVESRAERATKRAESTELPSSSERETYRLTRARDAGRADAYSDVVGTIDRLIRLIDGDPF